MKTGIRDILKLVNIGITDYKRVSEATEKLGKVKIEKDAGKEIIAKIRTSPGYYNIQIDIETGSWVCDCLDTAYRGVMCKHVLALLFTIDEERRKKFIEKVIGEKEGEEETITTGDEKIDKLLLGGLTIGDYLGVYGEPEAGKTWFALQSVYKHGGIYIDTEMFFTRKLTKERVDRIFKKRYGEIKPVYIMQITSLEDLLYLMGLELKIEEREKKTLVYIKRVGDVYSSPLHILMKEGNYKVVVIDSLSDILKAYFSAGEQDNPARAVVMNQLLYRFKKLLTINGATGIIINQLSKKRDEKGGIFGGKTLRYKFKQLLRIDFPPVKVLKENPRMRYFVRERYPTFDEKRIKVILKEDWGFEAV